MLGIATRRLAIPEILSRSSRARRIEIRDLTRVQIRRSTDDLYLALIGGRGGGGRGGGSRAGIYDGTRPVTWVSLANEF